MCVEKIKSIRMRIRNFYDLKLSLIFTVYTSVCESLDDEFFYYSPIFIKLTWNESSYSSVKPKLLDRVGF